MILNKEEFIINDISVDITPSDIQTFDDNYVFEQSFLRSNSVFCYRSKYSDTKVVLTFPFNLGPMGGGIPDSNNMEQCIKLAVQLNSYPFCFIKNKRVRAYVSPMTGSSTGFMMFAVEELAVVQASTASNVLFLEVTLRYFNHTPLVGDFMFVSNQVVNTSQSHVDKKGNALVYEREYLTNMAPVLTQSLSGSEVWKNYMQPKYDRVMERLTKYGLLQNYKLDLKVYLPIISTIQNDDVEGLLSEHDGDFIAPDSKIVYATNESSLDGEALTEQIKTMFSQDFSDLTTPERSTQDEMLYDSETTDVTGGSASYFIQYTATAFNQMGMAVDKVEVRRSNSLASQKIGAYKHPIIQYLGKRPARTSVYFTSNSSGAFDDNTEDTSILTFFNSAIKTLDSNRLLYPEVEAFNNVLVSSFATILLGADKAQMNQQLTSASAQTQGLESLACTFTESNTEEFLEQLNVEASGAKSISKIQDDVESVVFNWIRNFNKAVAKDRGGWMINLSKQSPETFEIFKMYVASLMLVYSDFIASTEETADTAAIAYLKMVVSEYMTPTKSAEVLTNLSILKSPVTNLRIIAFNQSNERKIVPIPGVPVGSLNPKEVGNTLPTQTMTVSNYLAWGGTYIEALLAARQNRHLGGTTNTENLLLNIAQAIGGTTTSNQITQTLSNEEKHFLTDFMDDYAGSLFGQNIEDLKIDDLVSNYDKSKDVVIQSTDPFFFLHYNPVMQDDMIDFFNDKFQTNMLDPTEFINEDKQNEEGPSSGDNIMGMNLEGRKLKEVDFDADNFVYNSSDALDDFLFGELGGIIDKLVSLFKPSSEAPVEALSQAIEQALKDYGFSGNSTIREYTYSVAMIESTFGSKLSNDSGARGAFQLTMWPIASLMMWPSSKIMKKLNIPTITNLDVAHSQATKLKESKGFKENHYLNACIFLEYLIHNGGMQKTALSGSTYDFAATFAAHNNGLDAQKAVITYLSTNKSTATGKARTALITNGGSSSAPEATWYSKYTSKFKSAQKAVHEYVLKGAADSKPASTAIPKGIALPTTATKTEKTAIEKQSDAYVKNAFSKLQKTATTSAQQAGQNITSIVKANSNGAIRVNFKTAGASGNILYNVTLAGIRISDWVGITGDTTYLNQWTTQAVALIQKLAPIGGTVIVNYQSNTSNFIGSTSMRLVGKVLTKSNVDIAKELLSKGLAMLTEENTDQNYVAAQAAAQKARLGIWSKVTAADYEKGKVSTQAAVKAVDSEILQGAQKGAKNYNSWVPFNDGQSHRVSSEFTYGRLRTDVNTGRPHNGIDLSTNKQMIQVIAAAPGICTVKGPDKDAGGLRVYINHGNGFETRYMHLSKQLVKTGQKVVYGQVIGITGGTGAQGAKTYDVHLHYEVLYKGRYIHPFSTRHTLNEYATGTVIEGIPGGNPSSANAGTGEFLPVNHKFREDITEEQSVFNEDELATAIIHNAVDDLNVGMKAAIPAIKAYAVYGNENDGLGLDTLKSSVQLYEIKGICDFKVICNSDQSPIDVALMTLVNPSFRNTDGQSSMAAMEEEAADGDYKQFGTDFEKQFKNSRIRLKPGTKVLVKLGYGNDPNKLTTVFSGGIMEVSNAGDSNQLMSLLLEGYGRELLQEIMGNVEPEKLDGDHNSPTTTVIGKSLDSKPIDHFGYVNNYLRWLYKGPNDPEAKNLIPGFFSRNSFAFFNVTTTFLKSRLYMNIFAAEIEAVDDEFANYGLTSLFASAGYSNHQFGYPFYIYRMTPWDCCKQMEYRHPGTIFKPLMFEDRMTLFFGVKEQMYFARDLSKYTQHRAAKFLKKATTTKIDVSEPTITKDAKEVVDRQNYLTYLDRRRERMEPVCNIHFATSSNNLISNNLKLNSQWSTVTNVSYFVDNEDFMDKYAWDSVKMSIDDNILPWEIREKYLMLSGTHGAYVAFLYGITDLKKQAEQMYGGSILITGNPRVKAGDYIFVDDVENRISGLVLVRDCIHHFSGTAGFVTEIVPGQYVEAARFMYSTLWLRLMVAFKFGASKTRLMASTGYTSEFALVKDYLKVMNQLEIANSTAARKAFESDGNAALVSLVGSVLFGAFLSYRLASVLGVGSGVPGLALSKFSVLTAYNFITNAEIKLAKQKLSVAGNRGLALHAKTKYLNGKTRMIQSKTFRLLRASKPSRLLRNFMRTPAIRLGTTVVGTPSRFLLAGVARASLAGLHAFSAVNPIALAIDVILSLAISVFYARMEKNDMTRQPLLFFPLIKHGKPYTAGMTGNIRNGYIQGLMTEYDKTIKALNKAASLFDNSATAKGERSIMHGVRANTSADYDAVPIDERIYNLNDLKNIIDVLPESKESNKPKEARDASNKNPFA